MTPTEQRACAIVEADLPRPDFENSVPWAYQDSLGFWTIGVGFLIDRRKGGRLLPEEIAFILHNRVGKLLAGVQREPWYPAVAGDAVRLAGILNMQFQLGGGSDEDFARAFAFIGQQRWQSAGRELRASAWRQKQTPARAERVIRMIETGMHA